MHRFVSLGIVTIALAVGVRPAFAQNHMRISQAPKAEVGLFGGAWSFDPSGFSGLGGRVTINRSDWFATEVSVEARRRDDFGPGEGLVLANARLLATKPAASKSALVTAGVALGVGAQQTVSPMFGFGIQSRWQGGVVSTRGDFQYFPGGLTHRRSHARIVVGLVLALR